MRRYDGLNPSIAAVEDDEDFRPDVKAECLGMLEEASREAHEAFARYRGEVGIPDLPRKNARKPA